MTTLQPPISVLPQTTVSLLSSTLSSSSSLLSSTVSLPVSQTFKNHTQERDIRKQRLNKAVENVLVIADDLENNCRASLGLQLNNSINNQHHLEVAVKNLRTQIATLGKTCSTYNAQYEALITSVDELGSAEEYLRNTDSILQRIGDNFAFITDKLTSEE